MAAKYQIIARELEHQLRKNDSQLTRLPTEAELCARYSCSRQTVRSALAVLEEKGLIVRRQGSGSYLAHSAPRGSRRIAVLLPDKEEYLAPALLRGIRKAAGEAGYQVICLETGASPAREREQLEALLQEHPAGIVLEPITDVLGCGSEDVLAGIRAAEIPVVTLGGSYGPETPCVRGDDAAGAGLLTAHLASSGHRKIAAILKSDDSRGILRYRGCIQGAAEVGIRFSPENCLWYSEQERARLLDGDDALLHRFLRSYRRDCTAVVCFNDEIAFRLRKQLDKAELAVVSFDNSYLARDGQITSASLFPNPGAAAVEILLQCIDGKHPAPTPLTWHLNVRKSG